MAESAQIAKPLLHVEAAHTTLARKWLLSWCDCQRRTGEARDKRLLTVDAYRVAVVGAAAWVTCTSGH